MRVERARRVPSRPTLRPENFDHLPCCGRGLLRMSCFQGGRHRAACQRVVRGQQSDHEHRTMSRTRSWWQWQITAALGLYVHKLYQSDRELEQARAQEEDSPDRENHDKQEERHEG